MNATKREPTSLFLEANYLSLMVTVSSHNATQVATNPANFSVRLDGQEYGMNLAGFLSPGGCSGQLVPVNGDLSCWLFAFVPALEAVGALTYSDGAYLTSIPLSIPPGPAVQMQAGRAGFSAAAGVSISLQSRNGATTLVNRETDFVLILADGSTLAGGWGVPPSTYNLQPNGTVGFTVAFTDGVTPGAVLSDQARRVQFLGDSFAAEATVK